MHRRAALILLLAATVVVAVLAARRGPRGVVTPTATRPDWLVATEVVMATPITVQVPSSGGADAAAAVFATFRRVDERMSEWKDTSPLSAVNAASGGAAVAVPADLRAVVRRGVEIGALTDGAFDVTWAALWGLWDFQAVPPAIPPDDAIAERVRLVDYRRVEIDDDAGTVRLSGRGMMLGLGGIAKGHALDRAADVLRDRGVTDFLLSAGGQMMAGGRRGDRPWRIGIRDPRGAPDDFFAFLDAENVGVATSGDYERYFVTGGVRYHHVLDPRTGRPTRGLRSVTVVSPDATLADALSTAFMVLGRERALALAERLPDVEAVLVDDEAEVSVTSGLCERLQVVHAPLR